ncbi:MAG: YjjG family noncanonical pyrimidine nucleotidase [Acidobacteriota bacterium]|nr:YjjG family noncanonical pyrimidine nucleotidase [Acidobacteriota bacterium]MDH3524780.1 YjjG family noncanonical pyrimidine nucleotidase [Acidobacteriota bacterium]
MRYRWLLFDADGTLFDYDGAEASALERTLAGEGRATDAAARAAYHRINAALWKQLEGGTVDAATLRTRRFELLFAELDIPCAAARTASERYLVELAACARLLPGAEEVVRELAASTRMAIVTNGLADVQRPRFARSSIADLFELLTISDELGIAKPDPRILDVTLEALGSPPKDEVLMIGDSLTSDVQGGVNAGVDTCWLAPNGDRPPEAPLPTWVIRSLAELPAIVSGARGRAGAREGAADPVPRVPEC